MTFFYRSSGWRDAECLSAVFVAGAGALAVGMTRLPADGVPRCLLKTWTGVPCLTCGGFRALNALLNGHLAAAIGLQPLLSLLAIVAVGWMSYAIAGVLFGLPRVRVQTTRCEKILLVTGAGVLALANWVYLIVDGR